MTNLSNYLYIVATIFLGVYSQLIIRWQVSLAGALPFDFSGKIWFVARLLLNPWIISSVAATFFGGLTWMMAMTKFETSYAYPFISLQFVIILAASILIFGESFSFGKLIGTLLVVSGIVIVARCS